MVTKSLDQKLARILADPASKDFILADAKDADMAYGMASAGKSPEHHAHEGRFRSLAEYRELIRQNVKQGLVDIMLMSASTNDVLTIKEKLFENSAVTPAARANDTTDIHLAMGGVYPAQPSRPFRTAVIDHIMCGKVECSPEERKLGANLGLYSVTFNNNLDLDLRTLEAYKEFRIEAERKGFRHFMEVFDPNAVQASIPDLGRFINDMIARTLAGVAGKGRPVFLKIAYHGPAAMEQLASYDRTLVPGILGGSSGTTFDAFFQLWEARKYGARAALYGRMINNSEHQLSFIEHLRGLADGKIDDPAEAVKSYHGALQKLGIRPYRSLEDDLKSSKRATAYGGGATAVVVDGGKNKEGGKTVDKKANTIKANGEPDFSKMTAAEKIAWNKARRDRIFK
ncbi:MAG: hypothetical protein IT443_06975 [Phycisphaeraceae bacterium]|nr:hypothetical protein [Phycisphaeraceae bacterium]